ncbi:MAG: 2-octaprenyl-6-methoxyphenyl hydroxylase [Rhodobacteraceae bacterium]|nr:2-octaprenyl-6-methoxyphenyl hydroxylase [Paracoccaceae bacterium]
MAHDADVLIVGGGLVGASLALALDGAGLSSVLVDATPAGRQTSPDSDGRSYALALSSVRMLKAIGLWPALAQTAQPMLEIKVSDGRAGSGPSPFVAEFHHGEIEEGPMGHMVEDRHLRAALQSAMDAAKRVTCLSGLTVEAQEPGSAGIALTLSDGRSLSAPVAIGCDGRMSATASRAGIRHQRLDYGQTALVCAIAHERPHNGVAHQFFMPEGPLAVLPLAGNRSSIVWTEATARATAIQALSDGDCLQILRPRFGDFLGSISLAGARWTYPLGLSLADDFAADRVALAGDAAHAVHPIAGQGLNAGLRDVAALAEVLAHAKRRGEDIGRADVLSRYEGWRRGDVTTLALATDTFNRLFSNDDPILRELRDIGLGAVNAVPALRRRFIREAAGLSGDVPRLSAGQAI